MNIVKVLADKSTNRIPIGKQGENKATAVQFCVKTWLEMWPGATVALAVQPPTGNAYPAIVTTQDNITTWVITDADTAIPGIGKCELHVLLNDVVKKSITFMTYIAESFTAEGEAPDPVADWIEDAQAKLGEVDDAVDLIEGMTVSAAESTTPSATLTTVDGHYNIAFGLVKGDKGDQGVQGPAGADGAPGQDGAPGVDGTTFTPSVSSEGVISWTNDGNKQNPSPVNIKGPAGQDGAPGADGYSPTASVSKSGSTATITITDKNGTTTAQISDGQNGQDGQQGPAGPGLPSGGTQGQIVVKKSGTDYDTEWSDDLSDLKSAVAVLEPAATSGDVGKVPKVKTVVDGKVSEYEFGSLPSVPVTDVQANGTSVLSDGVANVPVANSSRFGVVKINTSNGVGISSGELFINGSTSSNVIGGTNNYRPIVPAHQHESTFYGLAKAAGSDMASSSNPVGTYTDAAKSAISTMLNGPVAVSGTTPIITALPGLQYVCGEVSTLDITLPASGCVDVVFESGSTPTVLTVTPPTGMTVEWANGFDSTTLEADTLYELNIKMVGTKCLGVAGKWT